jgi:hypothetical protein
MRDIQPVWRARGDCQGQRARQPKSGGQRRAPSSARQRRLPFIVICIGGLLLILLLSSCTVSKQAVQRDPFLAELYNWQQASAAHGLQQTFDIGNTEWTITSAQAARALRLSDSRLLTAAQGMFVIVMFTFQNQSTQVQRAPLDMIQVQDVRGKKYSANKQVTAMYAPMVHATDFFTTAFQLNRNYRCIAVFDLPATIGRLSLAFHSFPEVSSDIGM